MQVVSRLYSRIQTRRESRIDTAISSTVTTFARTGAAYLDGVSYAANTARFPNTAGTVGVLVEEATTNLATANMASVETDLTGFNSFNSATITRDTTTSWAGTASVKVVTPGSVTQEGVVIGTVTSTVGQPYTDSVYVKGTGTIILTYADTVANSSTSPVVLTSEWQRVSITKASAASAINNLRVITSGAQAVTFWVDGFQAENKAYATSWQLPGSARNAETLTIPAAGIMRPDRGTVIVKTYLTGDAVAATPAAVHRLFNLASSTGTNNIALYLSTTGSWTMRTRNAAGTIVDLTWANALTTGWHSLASRWQNGEASIWADSAKRASSSAPSIPASLDQDMYIGCSASATQQFDYPIAYVVIYDRALSDAEMAAATSGNLPGGYTAMVDFRKGTSKVKLGTPYRVGEWLRMGLDAPEG